VGQLPGDLIKKTALFGDRKWNLERGGERARNGVGVSNQIGVAVREGLRKRASINPGGNGPAVSGRRNGGSGGVHGRLPWGIATKAQR